MALSAASARTKRLVTHLRLCGFNEHQTNSIVGEVVKWESHNGPEWTVNRLKALKEWLINLKGGNLSYYPTGHWIATKTYPNAKIPKGIFGFLFRHALTQGKIKPFIKALSAIMVYTDYKSESLTPSQAKKTIDAFTAPFSGNLEELSRMTCAEKMDSLLRSFPYLKPNPCKYDFSFVGLNSAKPTNQHEKSWLGSFMTSLGYRPIMRFLRKHFGLPTDVSVPINSKTWSVFDMLPGSISVLQERGFKARVVAMPLAGLQVCLRPLHNSLNSLLRSLPEDCTFDQESGADFARDSFREGLKIYSIDLSSATDRFPREYSLSLLRAAGFADEADLISIVSNDEWRVSPELARYLGKDTIKYSVGQPQGMIGSFPLFAWSHHCLLHSLIRELKEYGLLPDRQGGYYRILGDDIIINNNYLAKRYMRAVTEVLGVNISLSKSIVSHNLAEFASFLVDKSGYNKPKKMPNTDFFSSYVSYVKTFGHKAIANCPKRLQETLTIIAELPQRYGGLGLNPMGKPSYIRESIVPYLYKRRRVPEGTPMVSHITRMLVQHPYMSDSLYWLFEQSNQIEELMRSSLPGLAKDIDTCHMEELFQIHSDYLNSMRHEISLQQKFSDHLANSPNVIQEYSSGGQLFTGLETTVINRKDRYEYNETYKQFHPEGQIGAIMSAVEKQTKLNKFRDKGTIQDLEDEADNRHERDVASEFEESHSTQEIPKEETPSERLKPSPSAPIKEHKEEFVDHYIDVGGPGF